MHYTHAILHDLWPFNSQVNKGGEIFTSISVPRRGSVVVEHLPGMQEVGGLIPGYVKQKTLKFEVLLLCFALSIKELETHWLALSQDNGLGWNITAYPWLTL